MKSLLILVILYTVLANVYTVHLFSKFGHKNNEYSQPAVTYQEEKVVSPAKIYVEVKQKTPVYTAAAEVQPIAASERKNFDLLGHFKNKFGKILSTGTAFMSRPVVHKAPAQVRYQTVCGQVPVIEQPATPIVNSAPQQQQYYVEAQPSYEQAAPAQVYQQVNSNRIPLQVYRIPLNSEESSGKHSFFGKFKSHFGHKSHDSSSSNGAQLQIVLGQPDANQNDVNADSKIYVRNDDNLDNSVEPRVKVVEENKANEVFTRAQEKP